MIYSYDYNENTKELKIYERTNKILATISDVKNTKRAKERMFKEVVKEIRNVEV